MQRLIAWLMLTCVWLGSSGCATSYWKNRRDDLKDTVTLVFGKGAGVDAKVSFLRAGAILNHEYVGLQGGKWHNEHHGANFNSLIIGSEAFANDMPDYQFERGKSDEFWNIGPICIPGAFFDDHNRAARAGNSAGRVELSVGLGVSLKLGFNILELLDLVAGLWGADLLNDDLNGTVDAIILYPDKVVLRRHGSDDRETVENSAIEERLRALMDKRELRNKQFVLMPCYYDDEKLMSKAAGKDYLSAKKALSPEYTNAEIAQIEARKDALFHWFLNNNPFVIGPWIMSHYYDTFHPAGVKRGK